MKLELTTPVEKISQVGKATASRLKKLGILNVLDLIFYYPFRYEDFSQVSKISELKPFTTVTVKGKIEILDNRRSWKTKKMLTEGIVVDKTGSIKVIWFNQPFLAKVLEPGDEVYLSGRVGFDRYDIELVNPIYEKVKQTAETVHTARIVPIYSVTEGLSQKQIRWLIKTSLSVVNQVLDWLPEESKKRCDLMELPDALDQIHFPSDNKKIEQAVKRLKFDELFLFLLQAQLFRKDIKSGQARSIKFYEEQTKTFVASLPFTLTNDQKKSAWQILRDLEKPEPMNRLLEGEVGSGKTVVAAIAIFNAALNGLQSVLMAPTEILASQHFENFKKLFSQAMVSVGGETKKLSVALLTRANQKIDGQNSTKAKIINKIKSGEINFVVGTHSLIQENVLFNNLALVIIDEQHRFGVEQRKILHRKGTHDNLTPHFLSMTATPIPRSLALTLFGDLDLSIIKELPKERKKIITEVIEPAGRAKCYSFIRQQVQEGRQVFVICPLIDPSDKLGVKSVSEEYEKLKTDVFPDLKIAKLHGKLKPAEKEQIMSGFAAGDYDILVATSVVEVGINVPNAAVMLIEDAERFGLAQLYQFRGRVGRGPHQSYCFLQTGTTNEKTKARLEALVTAKDAFELAELDLELRGPGEIFGLNQSGFSDSPFSSSGFRIASLFDQPIISLAQAEVKTIIGADPTLAQHQRLKAKIEELNKEIHLE